MSGFWQENRPILGHIGTTLIIEAGLTLSHWLGKFLGDGMAVTILLIVDEWAALGIAIWFVRNLAVNLWNNRERLGPSAVLFA